MKKAALLLIIFSFTFFIAQAQNSFLFSKDQILAMGKCKSKDCITAIANAAGYVFISKAPSTLYKGCTTYVYFSTGAVSATYRDTLMLKNRLEVSLNSTTFKVEQITYLTANLDLYNSQFDEFEASYIVEDLTENEDINCTEYYSFVYEKMNIWRCVKTYKDNGVNYSHHSIRFALK